MTHTLAAGDAAAPSIDHRKRTADRCSAARWPSTAPSPCSGWCCSPPAASLLLRTTTRPAQPSGASLAGILFFYVIWGFIWYGVKTLLLKYFVGFTKEERRQAFSSRMDGPFDVAALLARYSERRIRIADMIGRRGRFITLAMAGFFYLYARVATEPPPAFATLFLQDNLFDAVVTSWIFLGVLLRRTASSPRRSTGRSRG